MRKLIALLLIMATSGMASAETPLIYASSSLPYPTTWQQVFSRAAACPAWADYENTIYGTSSVTNPRPGKWSDAGSVQTSTYQFQYDAMGNLISEQTNDPNGALTSQVTRVYDALSRLQQVTGAAQ
jgi:YD repeat-containing protein